MSTWPDVAAAARAFADALEAFVPPPGPQGPRGLTGARGGTGGYTAEWEYNVSRQVGDPGKHCFSLNASPDGTTRVCMSLWEHTDTEVPGYFVPIVAGSFLSARSVNRPFGDYDTFEITGPVVNHGDWYELPVEWLFGHHIDQTAGAVTSMSWTH